MKTTDQERDAVQLRDTADYPDLIQRVRDAARSQHLKPTTWLRLLVLERLSGRRSPRR